jgi:hypothetical protein
MYDSEELKVLCGNTIEEPELEYDDEELETNSVEPVIDSGLMQYYYVNVTDYMNHPEFMINYQSVIGKIKKMPIEHQRLLAFSIIQKMPEKYDFEFSIKLNPFYNHDDINELYQFIEFVEYDHEKLITDVWSLLKPDTNPFQLEKFCEHNNIKIILELERQANIHYYSEMIADFLRTYNKDKLIEWFCKKSKNLRSSILITLLRKEQIKE